MKHQAETCLSQAVCTHTCNMPGVAQRFWSASTLQGRRWMMERRLEAVEENDVEKLQELIEAQGHCKPRELTNALEIALSKRSDDYADCVALLVENGANPNGKNGSGTPFLHLAADAGSVKILKLLLSRDCLLQQSRDDGASALHRAAWRGHVHCVQLLLDAGADVNARDALGRTPAVTAAQGNNTACVLLLINNGCDVNAVDSNGMSVLAWSPHYNNAATFDVSLVASTSDVINGQDPMGRTPLHIAASERNLPMLSRLLQHGASANLVDVNGRTPLHISARQGQTNCVDILVHLGESDVNMVDRDEATPLVYLLAFSESVMTLLNAGADPNRKMQHNVSPLWACCINNYSLSAKMLLQGNAQPDVPGGFEGCKLPLQIALYEGFTSIAKMLLVASVAMAVDLSWLHSYLSEDNFRQRVDSNEHVSEIVAWVNDVIDAQQPRSYPRSLQAQCRMLLRNSLGSRCLWKRLGRLKLPGRLKSYLRLKELDDYIECEH